MWMEAACSTYSGGMGNKKWGSACLALLGQVAQMTLGAHHKFFNVGKGFFARMHWRATNTRYCGGRRRTRKKEFRQYLIGQVMFLR